MIIHRLHSKRSAFVSVISFLSFVAKMNCSAISLPHPATAIIATNGCSASTAVFSGSSFLNNKSNNLTGGGNGGVMAPLRSNCTNANGILSSSSSSSSSSNLNGSATRISKKPEIAAKIIKDSNIICFDVDSTVITEEGIDELARFCGKGNEVARVTKEAMGGNMTFQEALKIRLNIMRPTQQQICDFIKTCPPTLSRNLKCFVEHLKANNKQVYLISGGFDCLIEPVAKELDIPMSNVFANKLMFYYNGEYASFDTTQPTSKSGGKAEAISIVKKLYQNNNNNNNENNNCPIITMIGDGATDLEAVPPANYFIGFGGNVVRAEVFKRAQYYVTDFQQLM